MLLKLLLSEIKINYIILRAFIDFRNILKITKLFNNFIQSYNQAKSFLPCH